MQHHNAERGDGEESGGARDRVVDSRSDAGALARDRRHDGRRQRRDAHGHAESEDDDRREESFPVAAADCGQCEQKESERGYRRPDDEREFRAVAFDKPARPAREREHYEHEGKRRRARRSRGVALHLNQVEREEEECAAERRV